MRRWLLLIMCVVTGCAHTPVAARPDASHVIARALPSLVLLVGERPDGKTSFGSGLIVTRDGQVLTCLHLVRGVQNLKAMRYEPTLVSYTPMDGGLDRFLFENRKKLLDVRLERIDEANDLALVRVDADTSNVELLPMADEVPHRGDAVLALGHPRETVWSFTSGVVSTLHLGAIQHDAAINPGSSGGPLLNEKGEVVGITSAKVFGDTDGVSFARPISMASWLLEESSRPFALDQSTPEKAASSCLRAQEMASPNLEDCFDWSFRWEFFEQARRDLSNHVDAELQARLAKIDRANWLRDERRRLRHAVREGEPPLTSLQLQPLPETLSPLVQEARALLVSQSARVKTENHLDVELSDQRAIRKLLRKGVRVEATLRVKRHLAWVLLVGRNIDGSEYRYSEVWAQDTFGTWHQRTPAGTEELASLPNNFAPPLVLPGEMTARMQLELLGQIFTLSGETTKPVEPTISSARR
ncbi:MAG: S1C family serine protease [Archangium sp.]